MEQDRGYFIHGVGTDMLTIIYLISYNLFPEKEMILTNEKSEPLRFETRDDAKIWMKDNIHDRYIMKSDRMRVYLKKKESNNEEKYRELLQRVRTRMELKETYYNQMDLYRDIRKALDDAP